jgi:HEAT repeat protein
MTSTLANALTRLIAACTARCAALAEISRENVPIQSAVAACGAVPPLVRLLQHGCDDSKEEAASAIWALADGHVDNKEAIAAADGLAPLVALIGEGSEHAQAQAAGALAAVGLDHPSNQVGGALTARSKPLMHALLSRTRSPHACSHVAF